MNAMDYLLAQATETTGGEAAAPAAGQEGQTETTTGADGGTGTGGANGEPVADSGSPLLQYGPLILIGVIFYFFMIRGPRKRQNEQKMMLSAIKKGDKVQTIGGIVATVVDVRDDEVVLKIDEANNTKMRVLRHAIGRVIKSEDAAQ